MVKIDMGKAWSDAVAMLGANFGLVTTLVGLFYFLPNFAVSMLVPELSNPPVPATTNNSDPDAAFQAMLEAMQGVYATAWPYLLATTLLAFVGSISVLMLFSDRGNPTVGDALKEGFLGTPTYLATQIIFGVAVGLVVGLLVALAFAISPVLGILLGLVLLVGVLYASIKLLLVPAVIGMEGERNPITAMKRSWQLTKGNSLRIFGFLLILFIVVGLITLVATMAFGVVFAIMGEPTVTIGTAFLSSLSSAVTGGLFLLVIAAIHRQLTGGIKAETETFE